VENVLSAQGLSYAYPTGTNALRDITLTLRAGESVGLVGPNGAGKTTLFLCLAGVLSITSGQAEVLGLDVRKRENRQKIPRSLGILFQDSDDQIFHHNVFEDVAFGPLNLGLDANEVRARVALALKQTQLEGYEQRVPFHLSGGEKRRVALAGVLAMEPEVLLLDEPTLHLDPRSRRELLGLINGLGKTKLIASHDLEFVLATCSRVLILDGGEVRAEGPTREVLANPDLMDRHGLEVPWSLRRQNIRILI
jgi:cobalt/nickel transport system ATP-binding protein